jgi:sulfatase modifying factor 1
MAWVPEGSFQMGSEDFYPEEGPIRHVEVDGFWMDRHPVTVADFQRFVDATSYVTLAERLPDPAAYPDADPDLLVPGALVFHATSGPVDLDDYRNWWSYQPGASWHTPEGPGSTVQGRDSHPVTQVAFEDAQAYATWTGKQLPTEAEWEFAARGGLESKVFAWGDTFAPNGRMMANTWQGEFPWQNMLLDRFERTSPVDVFPPNGFGFRHDRQRLGVDERLLYARRGARPWVLRTPHLPGRRPPRRRSDPQQRGQGWFTPVRPELLPPLPTCRPLCGSHRHVPDTSGSAA